MKNTDKQIKMDRLGNNFRDFMNKKGLNNTNITEDDLREFTIENIKTINRSAFYNQLNIFKEILDVKGIKYDLKETELIDDCLYFDESKYFKKTQILDIINLLINAQDKLLIYMIFNKILGKGFKDLLEIKLFDIAEDYSYINVNGNKILCDEVMKELVKDTIEQEVYVNTTKTRNVVYYDLNMNSEYLFKTLSNKYTNNGLEPMKRSNLSRRFTNLSEELQYEGLNINLTATGIYQSGILHDMFLMQILDNIVWSISNIKNYLDINGYKINQNELAFKYHHLYYGTNSSIS